MAHVIRRSRPVNLLKAMQKLRAENAAKQRQKYEIAGPVRNGKVLIKPVQERKKARDR